MAKGHKKPITKLYPINIDAVKKLLKTLRLKETDPELKKAIECLESIVKNIYGHVLVCKFPEEDIDTGEPCCGLC